MRVLQVLPELNVGGVERGVIDLARAMKKHGEEIHVMSRGGALVQELVKMGVPHYALPVHDKSIWSLRLVKEIAKIIERERIDIVHARSRVPAWLAYLAARRTNCDFITTCHGYYSKHFLSRIMGWGKRVIVISHSIGRRMIDDFHVPPERIRLIHRGVDLTQYTFSPEKYLKPAGEKFKIVNIGRITPIKGQKEFIQAIHLLSKQIPNVEAWIVGSADDRKMEYFEELKLFVERTGMTKHVKFLGTRRDIPELLREADLLVLSTKIPEAFGRVIIEAGAVGTAVCASRIGGILDIVEDGKNGLLFYPLHIEEMVKAMTQLLKNRKQCYDFAHKLREKVEREFSLEQMVDKTLEVYRETRQERRILIIKLGAAGDLVLAIPSFRMLRKKFPNAHISLLVDSKLTSLVENCPYINEVIAYDRGEKTNRLRRLLKLSKSLAERRFDLSIDLQNNAKTHLISFLGRIRNRIGYLRGWSGHLLSKPVLEPKQLLAPIEHQFELLKRVGITQLDTEMELWPTEQSEKFAEEQLNTNQHSHQPLVGFVMGSSPGWPTKRWPVEHFRELAERIVQDLDGRVVLLGAPGEEGLADVFKNHSLGTDRLINLIGKTTFSDMASVIKRSNVLVSGDSAPIHIAAATKTKLVAFFGPTEPKRHLPPGADHAVLVRRIPCQPCYSGHCKNPDTLECLKKIKVNEVFEQVKYQLASAQKSRAKHDASEDKVGTPAESV